MLPEKKKRKLEENEVWASFAEGHDLQTELGLGGPVETIYL